MITDCPFKLNYYNAAQKCKSLTLMNASFDPPDCRKFPRVGCTAYLSTYGDDHTNASYVTCREVGKGTAWKDDDGRQLVCVGM